MNPKESTFAKLALIINDAYHSWRNPEHSQPLHFEKSVDWFEERLSRVRLKSGKRERAARVLILMGLIDPTEPHRASVLPKAITYRFKQERFQVYEVEVPVSLAEKFEKLRRRKRNHGKRKKEYQWIEESIQRVTVPRAILNRLKRSKEHKRYAELAEAENVEIKVTRAVYINHPFRSFPKNERGRLLFDRDFPVACLDVSGAHVMMLPWFLQDEAEFRQRNQGKRLATDEELESELANLRAEFSESDFYVKILKDRRRKAAKKVFLSFLNGADFPEVRFAAKQFSARYPLLARLLKGKRMNSTPRKFSDELQGRVTEILIQVIAKCREAGIPCFPVTDELIVPFKDRLDVLEWMHEEIFERTGVRAVVDEIRMPEDRG